MGETFYTALGVESEADGDAIRRAYRDLVKECHPDVSDDPAASERFKRLTTARDVLLDDDERARYDRLGHDEYVSLHVESGPWAADAATRSAGDRRAGGTGVEADRTARRRAGDSTQRGTRGRAGQFAGRRTRAGGATGDGTRARQPTGDRSRDGRPPGGRPRDGQPWQRASRVYRRAETDIGRDPSVPGRILGGLRAVGPWLPIHVVLVLSALATGWFTYRQATHTFEPSVTALSVGVLAFGVIVSLSVVHVVSQIYT